MARTSTQPAKTPSNTAEEIEDIEAVTADALSDLPIDAVRKLVEKQPLSALAVAIAAGYAVSNDPKGVARNAQRLILSLF